ncbi:MAG: hypothetical protein J5792_08305 [Bacteroidales bacterium]|nr:hypothetical protein [Bacteroidales bacterium]
MLGIEAGTILSDEILKVFVLLFAMCINIRSFLRSGVIVSSWVIYFIITVFFMLVVSYYNNMVMLDDLRAIAICLVSTMIGWQLVLSEKKMRFMLLFYAVCIGYVTYMQVTTNVGGFEIADNYLTDNKNSLGAMLATGIFCLLFLQANSKRNVLKRLFLILLILFFVTLLLTIRARTAAVALVFLFLYFYYRRYRRKGVFLLFFLGTTIILFVVLMAFPLAMEYIRDSFVQNYEGGDITSGRMERNIAGLKFLSEHMWAGELEADGNFSSIHNYPLNKWCGFGLFFSIPILLYYLVTLCVVWIRSGSLGTSNIFNIGYFALLIPFVVSMAEPTYPFGPGTATVFNFILFGVALRDTYDNRLEVAKM